MWIKKIEPNHTCVLPGEHEADPGSVWRCDHCGQHWQLFSNSYLRHNEWSEVDHA